MAARLVGKPLTGSDQSQEQGHIKTKHYFSNFSRITRGLVFILKHKQPATVHLCETDKSCLHTHPHTHTEHTNAPRPRVFAERGNCGGGTEGELDGEQRARAGERQPDSAESGLNLTVGNATTVCLQAVTEARQRCWRPPRLTANTRPSQTEEVASQGRTTGQDSCRPEGEGRGEGGREGGRNNALQTESFTPLSPLRAPVLCLKEQKHSTCFFHSSACFNLNLSELTAQRLHWLQEQEAPTFRD